MMKQIETDICIIGGGSGGLSLAAGAVQMGARVVLFEGGQPVDLSMSRCGCAAGTV